MPTLVPDGEFGFDPSSSAPFARLEDTGITRDSVEHPTIGRAMRITVAYTLTLGNETFTHLYEFYTDSPSSGDSNGDRGAWDEFVGLITAGDDDCSIIFHAKRSGDIMQEFLDLCEEDKQHAATA